MTQIVVGLDAATLIVWLATSAVLVRRGIRGVGRARWVLVGLAATTAVHMACTLAGWAGFTTSLEHLEDYLGATLPMWWAFVIYAFAQEAGARDLRESEARFRALVEQAADAVYVTDPTGRVADANQQACASLGYAREELVGAAVDLFEIGATIDRARVDPAPWESEGSMTVECRHRRKDGTEFPVEVRLGPMHVGSDRYVLALARDVSERQRTERERARLHEELLQAQRLESLGLMAGGVAHDFANLVTIIMGAAAELQSAAVEPEHRAALKAIEDAADNAAAITKGLLGLSRRGAHQAGPTDLDAVVRQCADLLRRVLPSRIDLSVTRLGEGRLRVPLDSTRLQQIVLNLAINARDAMPSGGRLEIHVRPVSVEDVGWLGPASGLEDGAVLAVSDTGAGIPPETLERVFEPLFTTKDVGCGTGLGLAIVHRIVDEAGGRIDVRSELGAGATFLIALPPAGEEETAPTRG